MLQYANKCKVKYCVNYGMYVSAVQYSQCSTPYSTALTGFFRVLEYGCHLSAPTYLSVR